MFLLESRALCRPLETGIKLDAHRLTDRDYLDSPTRWQMLSPEAELFLRTGSGANEKIRDYSQLRRRPSTPTSPTPGNFSDEEIGMKRHSSLCSMASEDRDFDVESDEEEDEEPLVYRYDPSTDHHQLPSLTGILFPTRNNSQSFTSQTNPSRRFISHQAHPSNSSSASSLFSDQQTHNVNSQSPPLIFLQSPTAIVSPTTTSSDNH